jgi:arylformamidase
MTVFDVSLPLEPGLAVWPGDTPFSIERISRIDAGDLVNLGSIRASLHAGTHVDAPFHFKEDGTRIDEIELEVFVGPAVVVDVTGHKAITVQLLEEKSIGSAPRLLLKTGGWTDHSVFPESVPVIAPDVPAYFREQGIRLLGVDVPSVDPIDSEHLANHHELAENGITILESLDLTGVEPGLYQLAALPMRVVGGDAAPVRAVLWR